MTLVRLIENINDFIPPRIRVKPPEYITDLPSTAIEKNEAATGFYVFNKLATQNSCEEARAEVVLSAIESVLPMLVTKEAFTLQGALELAGWPKEFPLSGDFAQQLSRLVVERGLLSLTGTEFKVADGAEISAADKKLNFNHMKERFTKAIELRLRRDFSSLSDEEASSISTDVETSLIRYFKEGGLTLATALFSNSHSERRGTLPASIIKFINDASTRYNDILKRQAFFKVSVDAFIHAESSEREYLGAISQGFFAFHSLGTFGAVSAERINQANNTVWLIIMGKPPALPGDS